MSDTDEFTEYLSEYLPKRPTTPKEARAALRTEIRDNKYQERDRAYDAAHGFRPVPINPEYDSLSEEMKAAAAHEERVKKNRRRG